MSESGGFHGSDSAQVRHEDKCRWWDDKEFCDCGAEPSQEVIDLRTQLTAALAERDEAREQLRISERQLANRIEAYSALSEITYGIEQERDRLAAQLDTAWQQGAEAMREAAASACKLRKRGRDAIEVIEEAIRAIPVPERKEG